MSFSKKRTRGFTLIETIVAVAVLTAALTGPLVLAQRSLKATQEARNRISATYLADEGIEVVRSMRDNNSANDPSLDRNAWLDGKDGGSTVQNGGVNVGVDIMGECGNSHACAINITQVHATKAIYMPAAIIKCPGGNCSDKDIVYQNTTTGVFSQFSSTPSAPWVKTPFRRKVQVEGIDHATNPVRQARITATVTFTGIGGTKSVVVAEDVYNWFPNLTL